MIIFCTGAWDLFHVGHLRLLKRVRARFENAYLIVGVKTDRLVTEEKNEIPIIPLSQRYEIIESLGIADEVYVHDEKDRAKLKKELMFDIYCVGNDRRGDFKEMTIKYFPYTTETSTTKIIERIRDCKCK